MKNLLRRMASKLSTRQQQELKRFYFARQLRKDSFVSHEPEYGLIGQWLNNGDWVLDIGANVGHYTKRLSDLVGNNGRVFAFEPVPQTFELLVANSTRFRHRNVTLLNLAVSDSTARLGVSIPKFATGLDNYYRAEIAPGPNDLSTITIAVDRLDIPNTIRLAKIDVEGHEIFALKGMQKILQRDHPLLIVEGDSSEVETFLQGYGYSFEKHDGSPNRIYKITAKEG